MAPTRSGKEAVRSDVTKLASLVQKEIDEGATTVEEVHKAIAGLPLDVLERLGVFHETVKDVRKIQETSIGAIYDVIRKVNHEVGSYAKDLLKVPAARAPRRTAAHAAPRKKG